MLQRWPTFLIIGVAKAGTTSLWAYLRQHPQVFMSEIKEVNYFAYEGEDTRTFLGHTANNRFPVRTREEYLAIFEQSASAVAVGEASPLYFESPNAAERIRGALPDIKLIVVLRNPVDRAVSDYMMRLRNGRIAWPPEEAFRENGHIVRVGLYHDKLRRYLDRFPREQLKICLFDDLQTDTLGFFRDLCRYLNVDPGFEPDVATRHRVGGAPRSAALQSVLARIGRSELLSRLTPASAKRWFRFVERKNLDRAFELPSHLRHRLEDLYRDDLARVAPLIQRDLSHWLRS